MTATCSRWTPRSSAYKHWLAALAATGQFRGKANSVVAGLPARRPRCPPPTRRRGPRSHARPRRARGPVHRRRPTDRSARAAPRAACHRLLRVPRGLAGDDTRADDRRRTIATATRVAPRSRGSRVATVATGKGSAPVGADSTA